MSDYVYISYSQKDSEFSERLTRGLVKAGINIWFDKMEIKPGENWQKRINEGLINANTLIFISSKNSLKSEWAMFEVERFKAYTGRIIPIIIDDFAIEKLPTFLREFQYVDFRYSFEEAFMQLLQAFSNLNVIAQDNLSEPVIKSKGYVFLSYCEEDSDFVAHLKEFLRENNYAYWDYEESDRDYHNLLFIELEDAIINAKATLSILSKAWKRSRWSIKEYFFSEEVGTPIFLLKAKDTEPTLVIAGTPFIDFTINSLSGYQKLKKELERKNL